MTTSSSPFSAEDVARMMAEADRYVGPMSPNARRNRAMVQARHEAEKAKNSSPTDAEYLTMTHAQLSELPGEQFARGFMLKTEASAARNRQERIGRTESMK